MGERSDTMNLIIVLMKTFAAMVFRITTMGKGGRHGCYRRKFLHIFKLSRIFEHTPVKHNSFRNITIMLHGKIGNATLTLQFLISMLMCKCQRILTVRCYINITVPFLKHYITITVIVFFFDIESLITKTISIS